MSGPHSLDTWTISNKVPKSTPGGYILSRDRKTVHYVGRSDTELVDRLNQHVVNHQKYTHFWFETTSSAKAAFELECSWWHKYQPDDNENHPDRPNGSGWQCPICNIFD